MLSSRNHAIFLTDQSEMDYFANKINIFYMTAEQYSEEFIEMNLRIIRHNCI